jgi:5'-phosphate synthase pdxT subunit
MKIGVVAHQGAVSEHVEAINRLFSKESLEGEARQVRTKEALKDLSGLIIPGGESTTISKLLTQTQMTKEIRKLAQEGLPIFGTCAGCILLAKEGDQEVNKSQTELLQLMDMKVTRNAFGRQKESFETNLQIQGINNPVKAVFIRAPAILKTWGDCHILSEFEGKIVMTKQNNLLAASFHPELTDDLRIHSLFLDMILKSDFKRRF